MFILCDACTKVFYGLLTGFLGDPSPSLTQSIEPPESSRQPTQFTDRDYRPAQHGQLGPGSHGTISTAINMADMASALPPYQAPARSFSQQNVQQQFIPAHQPSGMLYPVHQMPYLNPNAPGGTVYNVPYSPPYHNPYIQQHPQLQGGYSPYSPSHHQSGAPIHSQSPAYNPSYYAQHQYSPGYGEMQAAAPNVRIEGQSLHMNNEYRRSQLAQTSNTKDAEKRKLPINYDVSQTIVDGSSRMKQSRGPLTVSGMYSLRSRNLYGMFFRRYWLTILRFR